MKQAILPTPARNPEYLGASGITALSISSAFWGLVAGLAYLALHRLRHNGAPDREDEPS